MSIGYALAQGLAAGAQSASGMLGDEIKREAQEAAEDRAANRKLDLETRIGSIREAAAQRAEERKIQMNRAQGAEIKAKAKGALDAEESAVRGKLASQDDALSDDELASLSAEGRARYGLPDKGELAMLKREAAAAMEIGDTARAKEINDRIKDLESAERGRSKDATDERRHRETLAHQEKLARIRTDEGGNKPTANMKDATDIADTLFGGDRSKAYEYIAAQQGRARSTVVRDMLRVVNDDPNMLGKSDEEKIARAEKLADRVIAGDVSKSSVRTGGTQSPKQDAPPTNRPPLSSFRMQ